MTPDSSQHFIDVLLPLALPKTYTYSLSNDQLKKVVVGCRVAVPFGKQKIYTGIIVRIHTVLPQIYEPKPIVMLLDEYPVVTQIQLAFWNWLSSYYMCTQGEVLRACMPGALLIESESIVVKREATEDQLNELSDSQFIVYEALQKQNLTIHEISQITDIKKVMPLIMDMVDKNLAVIHQRLEEKFKPRKVRMVQLNESYSNESELKNLIITLERAPKQKAVLMALLSSGNSKDVWQEVEHLKKQAAVGSAPFKALIDRGVLKEEFQEKNRVLIQSTPDENKAKTLSPAQNRAFIELNEKLKKDRVVLFEGVTASGKTEVYIRLIEEELKKGKQVLYLLPEISLTSQIVSRLSARFGSRVLVYHSRFSIHERTEVWNRVLEGNQKGQVVVGARSAVLLPFKDIGLVIVDEEHENSYKQFDPAPRYQARDSAIYLANAMNTSVVLGSATPSMETAENARNGKYGWVKLTARYGGVALPNIQLIDLKEAHRKKTMKEMFSFQLIEAIQNTLELGKQVILFQNRRGYAPIMECESCGHSPQCTQCDVSMTYHQAQNQLRCHYCGYNVPMPTQCHACGMPTLSTKGVGTQQIEEQIQKYFPQASVRRMDWDSTRGKWSFDQIIEDFDKERIQILVGTQMVVKGLDFKNVLLVGVINADHVLNLPDFRAHERSYQMLCQVAGRAGRSDQKGQVLIQTFQPSHPILQQVINHDFDALFEVQKNERKQFRYPPYFRMIRITFKSRQFETVTTASDWFSSVIKQSYKGTVLGPVLPPVSRVRNQYIKHLIIKVDHQLNTSTVKKLVNKTFKSFQAIAAFRSVRVNFDVDPY